MNAASYALGWVIYGAPQACQLAWAAPPGFCQTASVPERVNPTAVQVVQLVPIAVPEVSNDAVEPAGGSISTKLAEMKVPELPDRVKVIPWKVPAFPERLYQASASKPDGLSTWQLGQ